MISTNAKPTSSILRAKKYLDENFRLPFNLQETADIAGMNKFYFIKRFKVKSQIEEIALQFGDILIPVIRELMQKYITPMIAKVLALSSGAKKNIVIVALLAAAIGPLLLIIGKLISSFGLIIRVASLLFTKVGLIVAIIAAVAFVVMRLWNTNEEFRNAVIKIWDNIKTYILGAVNAIKQWWDKNGEKLIATVVSALDKVWKTIKSIFNRVAKLAIKMWPFVKDIVVDTVKGIKSFWEQNGAKIWAVVSSLFKLIWEVFIATFDIISSAVANFLTYVRPIWESLKILFASLWDTIVDLYHTLKPV